ncbi:MAG TPA: gliding motility protein GldL [Flavisolibacter sp.]|nr:gliding motility protein GldL [Flavisolibacter sp.]
MAAAIPPKVSRLVDVFVSIAAAVVIWGALQKILHSPMADIMLKIGLTTEALVFLVYGVLYLMYPAVDDGHGKKVAPAAAPGDVLGSLDKAMLAADITPTNLNRLGEGFKKLNTTISNMSDITDVVAATGDYTKKTKEVTQALSSVKEAYVNAANSVGAFNAASDSAKIFHDQIQVLTKNLASLNTIYELELQESNNHLKTLNQFYGKMAEASNTMVASVEDAKKVQTEISHLSNNLGKLNNIYGNMLSAMQGR